LIIRRAARSDGSLREGICASRGSPVDHRFNLKLRTRILRKLRRVALRGPHILQRRRGLARLRASAHPLSGSLETAIREAITKRTRGEEATWVEKTEALRSELQASTMQLETPLSDWTGEEAHRARVLVETVGDLCRRSRPPLWALLLFKLVRELQPSSSVELGTGIGISAAYQAAALELNGSGSLITIEAASTRASMARQVFERLGLDRVDLRVGRFEDLLDGVMGELESVDFAFIDGNHNGRATMWYLDRIAPYLSQNGVVVFDDISFSDDMASAWRAITSDERANLCVDLGPMGLCVYGDGDLLRLEIPLEAKPTGADRTWLSAIEQIRESRSANVG
jgi:predicted O-methyltransferase YrrM